MPSTEHDLRFETPATTWDEGLPLGNGVLGSLVWGDGNPLNISLDRTDLWDLRPVPEFHSPEYSYANVRQWRKENRQDELVQLLEAPYYRPAPTKIPAGRIEISTGALESSALESSALESSALDIQNALADLKFSDGGEAQVFLHAAQPIGVLRLRGASGAQFRLRAPDFGGEIQNSASKGVSAGDLSQLGYDSPQEYSGDNFQAFEQEGWGGFRFAVYLAWRADVQTTEGGVLLAWSIASSFEGDSEGEGVLEIARRRVQMALDEGFESLLESHQNWWREFWAQSSLQLPDKQLEKQWFLEIYKFGAAARRGAAPITLQGPWTADNGELPPWKGDFHHDLNTQLSYWPCNSSNHLEGGLGFLDWLWDTRENCREWTQRFFQMPGLNVPMTADLHNNQIGGWRQYANTATTAAWLCHHFYLHWKYSQDREFLQTRAYPYLRDCAVFVEAVTAELDENGARTLPLSSSPEIHDNTPRAWFDNFTNYDLSLMRWLLGATIELAEAAEESEDAEHWRGVLAPMPELMLAEDGHLLVAAGESLTESHRHFSHLMAIHPLGLITSESESGRRTIAASLAQLDELGTKQWVGYSFAWLGNLSARVGDGERAVENLKIFPSFTLRNSFHVNGDQSGKGYSDFTYRPFTLEGNFAFAAGVQEMLLQSWSGVLRVFPAIPQDWRDVSFESLRGEGAFLVSAELQNRQLARLEIRAERGGVCRVLLPQESEIREAVLEAGEVWKIK